MTEKQIEAFNAVKVINKELDKKWLNKDRDYQPILTITFAKHYIFISLSPSSDLSLNLPEINLYNSHHCDRLYFHKSDKYETFYKLIKRKFLLIKDELNNLKL